MNTTFLKDCLADALIALLQELRLEEINIQEITEKAGYHRASWFRNGIINLGKTWVFSGRVWLFRYRTRGSGKFVPLQPL